MQINYEGDKKVLEIGLDGDVDHHICLELAQIMDDAMKKHMPKLVIFDFREATFMDSSGIGLLLGRYKKLMRIGAKAKLRNVHGDLERILKMSGIYTIIPLEEE